MCSASLTQGLNLVKSASNQATFAPLLAVEPIQP